MSSEAKAIDRTISSMASIYLKRAGVKANPRGFGSEEYAVIDGILVEALKSMLIDVPSDAAEKLFKRMMDLQSTWDNPEEKKALGIVLYRFYDSMRYLVSYRGKYNGSELEFVPFPKDEALEALRDRGLARRK